MRDNDEQRETERDRERERERERERCELLNFQDRFATNSTLIRSLSQVHEAVTVGMHSWRLV